MATNWNKISLFKFQQIEEINSRKIDDLDKILFTVCVVYDMTEYELDNYNPVKAAKLCKSVAGIFSSPFESKPSKQIGKYEINYDPHTMRFGQYMELSFYMTNTTVNAHKIMASISNYKGVNDSSEHAIKSEYFLQQPIEKIIGSLKLITEIFSSFNKSYSWLFGLDTDVHEAEAIVDPFNKKYGWVYSAEQVAAYERITINEVSNLQTTHVFNDLAYLKAKSKYEIEQFKNK